LNIEVEALSESRRAKLERAVFDALDAAPPVAPAPPSRTSRRMIVGYAAAAAVVAAVGAHRLLAPVKEDAVRIATTDGASRFTFGEAALELMPRSAALVLGDDSRGMRVVLDRGGVTCEVAPRRGRAPFVVDAGDVRVRVTGTRFTVVRDDTSTRVEVEHGAVEVTAQGAVTVLHDGERWPAATASRPAPPVAVTAEPLADSELGVGERSEVRKSVPRRPPRASAPAPASAVPRAAPPTAAPSAPSMQARFDEATAMERSRPAEAATVYRELANGQSTWAPNALFALGRLQLERGYRAEGRALLERYLTSYPRGLNAVDARALLERSR
jgi:transmembrane sensor